MDDDHEITATTPKGLSCAQAPIRMHVEGTQTSSRSYCSDPIAPWAKTVFAIPLLNYDILITFFTDKKNKATAAAAAKAKKEGNSNKPVSPKSALCDIQAAVHKEARRRSIDGEAAAASLFAAPEDDASAATSPRSTLSQMQSSISATVRRRSIDEGHDSPPREGENSSAVIFAQSRDQASTMDAACPFGAFSTSPGADVHLDEAPLTAIHTEGKGPVMERAEEAMAAEESLGDGPSEAPEEKPGVEEKRHRRASKQLPPSAEIDAASPLDWQMKVRPILCAHMRDPGQRRTRS